MAQLTSEIKTELHNLVYDFFAEECRVSREKLHAETRIVEDLDGDSLLFVELIETIKKKYNLNIQFQAIGKYLLKRPAETLGQVVDTAYMLVEHENNIVNNL